MSNNADSKALPVPRQAGPGERQVDAHGAMGLQVGDRNTQIIYSYSGLTWTDGVAPPPLVSVTGTIDSPYRGLSAFEERDAAFFFGREGAAAELLEQMSRRLDGPGLMMVSGVSGAGKSSLLQAGVLPRVRGAGLATAPGSATWPCLLFTPAREPLDELAVRVASLAGADAAAVRRDLDTDPAGFALTARQAALAVPGEQRGVREARGAARQKRLLLVIDQFEQLFTQCPDEEQRQAFITALEAAATAGHQPDHGPTALVVLGVRADFEARCAGYPQLAEAVQDRYLVMSMTERQLRMAITEPARKAGSNVEDGLVDALLRDVDSRRPASRVGVLPLLSHALDQAWRSRAGDVLTIADYERIGGIEAAVAESAQRAYDSLTAGQQAAARQVFTRLTATSSDGVDTADRAARDELREGKSAPEVRDVEAVLEAFAAERLLTLAAGTVEISHEVLLTAWPLLRDTWLAETHADRIVRTRLHSVAADWEGDARDPSYLYSGHLLDAAADSAARIDADPVRHPRLSQTERDFLHASDRAHRRRVRRRHSLIALLMVLVVAFASAAVVTFRANQRATHQRDVAVSRQLINQSENLADTNPVLARLESIAAWRIHPSDDARYAMLSAAAYPGVATLYGHTDRVHSVAFEHSGQVLASGSFDGTIRLWNMTTRHQIGRPLAGHAGAINSVAFSPDGAILAAGTDRGTLQLWNVDTHQPIGSPLTSRAGSVESVAFSRDNQTLASGEANGTVQLWNVRTRRLIGTLSTDDAEEVYSVAFSPDGTTLAAGSGDHTVRLWNVATQQQTRTFTGHVGDVLAVAFSPDGLTLASGSVDGTVLLWNVATGRQTASLKPGEVFSLAFDRTGKILATGTVDDVVLLWDVDTRQPIGNPFTGYSLAFSPDNRTLATGSYDHTVRLWHLPSITGLSDLIGPGQVTSVAFGPDRTTLASGSIDGAVRLWDVVTHRQLGAPLTGHAGAVNSVAISPDDKLLASGHSDGTVLLWNMRTHRQIGFALSGQAGPVLSVAFSPRGNLLATGTADGAVRLWNVHTHRLVGALPTGRIGLVYAVTFSPGGNLLASGSSDGAVRLWNVRTRRLAGAPLFGHVGQVLAVAFSPAGAMLATGNSDNTVRLWNVRTHHPIGNPLTGHNDWVLAVAFSPDGRTLASGSKDKTVRLWDVDTHQQIGEPLSGGTSGPVTSVAFSPDGQTLASGSDDKTVRLWNTAYLAGTIRQLCAAAGRTLTPTEWKRIVSPNLAYLSVCPAAARRSLSSSQSRFMAGTAAASAAASSSGSLSIRSANAPAPARRLVRM